MMIPFSYRSLVLPDRIRQSNRLMLKLEKLPSIEDRGETDRVTTPTHAGLRRCCWPRSATSHTSPRYRAADYATIRPSYSTL